MPRGGAKGPCTLRLGSWNVTVPTAMSGPLRVSLAEVQWSSLCKAADVVEISSWSAIYIGDMADIANGGCDVPTGVLDLGFVLKFSFCSTL